MRLFVALDLNSRVVTNLTELVHSLAPMAPVRWVHPKNMHLTLKYIGDWEVERLEEVIDALREIRVPTRFNVHLAGLGFFPSTKNPRVFWATAENTPPLRQLASSVDSRLAALGIAPEVRPYTPHITLGRLRSRDLTEMHEAVEELPTRDFGLIEPESFALFGSQLTQQGPSYQKIEEFPFLMSVAKAKDHGAHAAMRY